jgi:hypothetical protein
LCGGHPLTPDDCALSVEPTNNVRLAGAQAMLVGCGLIIAGLLADNLAAHRWLVSSRPARLDVATVLAFALPAAGLAVMAALPA